MKKPPVVLWVYWRYTFQAALNDLPSLVGIARLMKPGVESGGGFDISKGLSDASFEFKTAHSAQCARARIKRAFGRNVRIKVKVAR